MTYREKLLQADREAKAAVVGLVLTIVVWLVCGIGLSGLDVKVFGTPLWIIGGTLGTWAFSIVVAVELGKRVFVDFDLDDGASSSAEARRDDGMRAGKDGDAPVCRSAGTQARQSAGAAHRGAGTAYRAASAASHAAGVQASTAHRDDGTQASAAPAGKDGGFRG